MSYKKIAIALGISFSALLPVITAAQTGQVSADETAAAIKILQHEIESTRAIAIAAIVIGVGGVLMGFGVSGKGKSSRSR